MDGTWLVGLSDTRSSVGIPSWPDLTSQTGSTVRTKKVAFCHNPDLNAVRCDANTSATERTMFRCSGWRFVCDALLYGGVIFHTRRQLMVITGAPCLPRKGPWPMAIYWLVGATTFFIQRWPVAPFRVRGLYHFTTYQNKMKIHHFFVSVHIQSTVCRSENLRIVTFYALPWVVLRLLTQPILLLR